MCAPGSEQALVSIVKWACRGEWRGRLDLIIDAHFAPALAAVGRPVEGLPELLGEAFPGLFACVVEDFLTCDFGADERNIVADYLKRRGFRERAQVKSYLRVLRRSVMSLYQVVTTVPGSHLVLRDLIRGGAPIRVEHRLGATDLDASDRIAARLLPINGKTWLSSGLLCLPVGQVQPLVDDIEHLRQRFRSLIAREAERRKVAVAELEGVVPFDDVLLGELAPIFTHVWLTAELQELLGLPPTQALLSTPLPALGGKSPTQAARSRDGRRQIAQWLKYQEARSHHPVSGDWATAAGSDLVAAADPDLSWMWQALRIEHLR